MSASPDALEQLIDALADLARRHRNLTVRLARESGRPASHVAVLAALARLGEVRLAELADELLVDPSVVSRHVSPLEQEGSIARRPDPADARAALIRVTDAGAQVLETMRELRRRHLQTALADWDSEEVAVLPDTLTRVARLLDISQQPHRSGSGAGPESTGARN